MRARGDFGATAGRSQGETKTSSSRKMRARADFLALCARGAFSGRENARAGRSRDEQKNILLCCVNNTEGQKTFFYDLLTMSNFHVFECVFHIQDTKLPNLTVQN